MRLLFLTANPDSPLDLGIAVATRRPNDADPVFCHVETQFDNGRSFSAHLTQGVRWIEPFELTNLWTVVPVPWLDTPELRAYADSLAGERYDAVAAALSALHLDFGFLPNHPYCSRVAGLLGRKAGDNPPCAANPNDLYRWCQLKGYVR